MAIGTGYGDNNGQRRNNNVDRNYYSRVKVKNTNVDLALNFAFSGGLLNISIDEKKDGFKYETVEKISLSPYKAKMMYDQIQKFKAYVADGNIVPGKAFGVPAGMGEKVTYIGIHTDETRVPMITIGKFDNSGNIVEEATIPFNKEYYFGLDWNDIKKNDVEKFYYDDVELFMFEKTIKDFAYNMNGALAYSVADLTRYDNARILGKMDPIYEKLGIERRDSGNGYSGRGNSFLDNQSANSSTSTSIDDILE